MFPMIQLTFNKPPAHRLQTFRSNQKCTTHELNFTPAFIDRKYANRKNKLDNTHIKRYECEHAKPITNAFFVFTTDGRNGYVVLWVFKDPPEVFDYYSFVAIVNARQSRATIDWVFQRRQEKISVSGVHYQQDFQTKSVRTHHRLMTSTYTANAYTTMTIRSIQNGVLFLFSIVTLLCPEKLRKAAFCTVFKRWSHFNTVMSIS